MSPIRKSILDWLVITAGMAIGVAALALLGAHEVYRWSPVLVVLATSLALCGAGPVSASMLALRRRRAAGIAYFSFGTGMVVLVTITEVALSPNRPRQTGLYAVALPSVLIAFGLYWFYTAKSGWPPVSRWNNGATIATFSFLVLTISTLGAISLAVRRPLIGDCGESRIFARPTSARHAAFIVHVVHAGPLLGAIGIVQQEFWGLPLHSKMVFMKWGKTGETYFVSAWRGYGVLTRFLPVFSGHCAEDWRNVNDAQLELRLMRDGPPSHGVRIIGRVLKASDVGGWFTELPTPGVGVLISGPSGSVIVKTDQYGIYDANGLLPGDYEVRLEGTPASLRRKCREAYVSHLQVGDIGGCELVLR